MKKRNLFIFLLVLVLVLFLLWWFWLRTSSDELAVGPAEEPAQEELTQENIQEEILKCEKEKAYFQAACFKELAVRAKDPELCERVSDIQDVGYEDSQYIIHEGVCLALVAKQLDFDVSLCEQVASESDQYELCTGYVAQLHTDDDKDPSHCENVDHGNIWYGNCLASSVVEPGDVGICDKAEGFYVEVCRDQAYINLATDKEDLSYCDSVREGSNKAMCVAGYAERVDDLSACHGLGSDKNICVCYNMYFDELSEEICDELSDGEQVANCQKCLNLDLFESL